MGALIRVVLYYHRKPGLAGPNFFPSEAAWMNRVAVLILICAVFISVWPLQAGASEKLAVFVSIVPQKYFVEKIGGDFVNISVMVKPGANPATYEPKPQQMIRLSRTQIYFAIGVPFEQIWLKKIAAANPAMRVVHTDAGIDKLSIGYHSHPEKEEGHPARQIQPHENSLRHHEILDPHIWLSPPLVQQQAIAIFEALVRSDPVNRVIYEQRYKDFTKELGEIHKAIASIFDGKDSLEFIVFHPSWGYFAHTYGLKQVAIEVEGKAPKPAQLTKLIQYCREHHIKVVFVQPQFSTKSAELVAREIGGQVIVTDPLAENWSENLRMVATKFQAVLK